MMRIFARGHGAARFALAIGAAIAVGAAHNAFAQGQIGVVLMHGKQGTPDARLFAGVGDQLQRAGMKVMRPHMPWARGAWEQISVPVEAVHAQIDGYVAQLRAQGAQRIVVGGQSLGANIALSYAAERGNVAGVVMISPGHAPAGYYQRMPDIRAAIDRAAGLVQAGQGAQPFSGPDNNQGRSFTISTTAAVYLSWLSPRGLASMPAQAPRLSPRIPLLMVIGMQDRAFGMAETSIYRPAAKHPYSKYVAVQGDHGSTLGVAGGHVVDWLQGLPRQ